MVSAGRPAPDMSTTSPSHAMRYSDDLFQLIKSLSKNEKRYFKLSASVQQGEKNYLKLFDAIAAQEEYDEPAIIEMFRGEKLVRQFNVAKHYLYRQILRALRIYHTLDPDHPDLHEMVSTIGILARKGLDKQAIKAADKAIELASEQEDFSLLLEAMGWRERVTNEKAGSYDAIDRYRRRKLLVLDQMRNLAEYESLLDTVALTFRDGPPRNPDALDAMTHYMQHPLMASEERALSRKARMLYRWCHSSYHYGMGNYRESLAYIDGIIELFTECPIFIRHHAVKFVIILNDRLLLASLLDDEKEFEASVERLRATADMLLESRIIKGLPLRSAIFQALYLNLIAHFVGGGEFERSREIVGEIEEGLRSYGDYMERDMRIKFLSNLAQTWFGLGDVKRALEYNNMVLQEPDPMRGRGTWHAARLTDLIIHYELGHHDLLEHRVRAASRYFRSRGEEHQVESAILECFRRLVRASSRSEELALLARLRDRLSPLRHDPLERNAFTYFHYIPWIESRLDGGSFAARARSYASETARLEKAA